MTQSAAMLGIIELPVDLEIGISPGLTVYRGAPFVIEVLMTDRAFPCTQLT